MHTSGQECGRGGGEGGPRPWPGPTRDSERAGPGRPRARRGRAPPGGSAPSGAGLKGGKARAGDRSHRQVHVNRGVARAQP